MIKTTTAVLVVLAATLSAPLAGAQVTKTSTVTGPNGQTATHEVAGRGTGTVSSSTTGPNGQTTSRTTTRGGGTGSTTLTGPNGQSVNRTVVGRGSGNATVMRSGPRGSAVRHR